jgi:hypothetical protein
MMHDPRRDIRAHQCAIETLDRAGRERLRAFKGVSECRLERGGDGK